MADKPKIQIQLTREQQLQLAAATGLMLSTLELDVEEAGEDGVALASIPEAILARLAQLSSGRGEEDDAEKS